MGLFLTNKSSNLNTTVTSSLFHLMIMAVLASLLLGDLFNQSDNSETILVEMAENAPPTANDKVWAKIRELGLEDTFEFIPKEESIKFLQAELGEDILLDDTNPLNDLFQIVMEPNNELKVQILEQLAKVDGVAEIFEQEVSSSGVDMVSSNTGLTSLFKTLLLIVLGILSWLYFNSKASEIINSSKKAISALSIYGAKPKYFKSGIRKFVFGMTLKSWMLGLLLFLLVFHLTLGHFGHGIADISISNLMIIVLAPLILLLFLYNVLISNKLDHCLKSI